MGTYRDWLVELDSEPVAERRMAVYGFSPDAASMRSWSSNVAALDLLIVNRPGLLVFTNGVFDLLNRAHVLSLLQMMQGIARITAAEPALVVGVNTDASVRRIKGPTRPVQSEQTRATLLACLGFVCRVFLFDDDTPLELIKCLQPDVLFKGPDYAGKEIVGADFVRERGGLVMISPRVRDVESTTQIIERIVRTHPTGGSAVPVTGPWTIGPQRSQPIAESELARSLREIARAQPTRPEHFPQLAADVVAKDAAPMPVTAVGPKTPDEAMGMMAAHDVVAPDPMKQPERIGRDTPHIDDMTRQMMTELDARFLGAINSPVPPPDPSPYVEPVSEEVKVHDIFGYHAGKPKEPREAPS